MIASPEGDVPSSAGVESASPNSGYVTLLFAYNRIKRLNRKETSIYIDYIFIFY
jgi:hypothetical protein